MKKKKYKFTKIIIEHQGAPLLNEPEAFVEKESKDIVCLSINLKSKYCDIGSSMSDSLGMCAVSIDANEHSLHLKEDCEYGRDESTGISFPEYNGWQYFGSSCGRYTLQICLVKYEE